MRLGGSLFIGYTVELPQARVAATGRTATTAAATVEAGPCLASTAANAATVDATPDDAAAISVAVAEPAAAVDAAPADEAASPASVDIAVAVVAAVVAARAATLVTLMIQRRLARPFVQRRDCGQNQRKSGKRGSLQFRGSQRRGRGRRRKQTPSI